MYVCVYICIYKLYKIYNIIFKDTYNASLSKTVVCHFPLKIISISIFSSGENRLISRRICQKKHCDKIGVLLHVYMSCTYIKNKMFSNACNIMKQQVSSLSSVIKRAIDENTCKEEKYERYTMINAYYSSQKKYTTFIYLYVYCFHK